jgi:hypothetical protein
MFRRVLLLLQWSLVFSFGVVEAGDVVLSNTVWRSEKFDSEWGKAYFELTFSEDGKCEWKALSPSQKEPMFTHIGAYAVSEKAIEFRMGEEIQGEGVINTDGISFEFTPVKDDEKVEFHKVRLSADSESALLARVRKGITNKNVHELLSLYDFSNVHEIYRDQEAFNWQGIISEIADGNELREVSIVPIEHADEYMKSVTTDGQRFQGRSHCPNLKATGILVVELGTVEESWTSYFVVGSSKGDVASLAGTIVVQENKEAEQAGTGQPATRPESKSEGGDKPEPEAEGRSR